LINKEKKKLRKEVKHVAKEREAISRLLKDKHDNHKLEKKKYKINIKTMLINLIVSINI